MDDIYALYDEEGKSNTSNSQSIPSTNANENAYTSSSPNNNNNNNDTLGVDDQEVVTKQRKVYQKLDGNKLLTEGGINYVSKKISKKRLFKGRGHEKGDLNRILAEYQMWAHKLYPKANFTDFIELCKKAGDSRAVKNKRYEIIDLEKQNLTLEDSEMQKNMGEVDAMLDEYKRNNGRDNDKENHKPQSESAPEADNYDDDMPDDDEMDELMAKLKQGKSEQFNSNDDDDDIPNYDELEELMGGNNNKNETNKEFEDEEAALAAEFGF